MINIVVCMKQVIDPEAPVSSFKVDPEAKGGSWLAWSSFNMVS